MINIGLFIRFFDRGFILKLLFLALLYSLLPLTEIFIILYFGNKIGNYLVLSLAASTGFIGVFIAFKEIHSQLKSLREKIRAGEYPGGEFIQLAGILAGSFLLLTPGFITDFLGLLLLFPVIRNFIGRFITQRMERHLKELYEYLKLYEL